MNVKLAYLSISMLIAISFMSCGSGHKQLDTPNAVNYDSITVNSIYHLENDSTKPSCSLKIKYKFAVGYSNDTILSKIQRELNYAMFEEEKYESLIPTLAVDTYVKDYIDNYKKESVSQFPDWEDSGETEDYFSFYKTIEGNVLFDRSGILSYQVVSMDYKGGANSSTIYRNVVIALSDGSVVTEEDIFVSDYKKILNKMLTDKVLAQNNARKPEDLLELGFWGIEDMATNYNFYVDNNGLTYIFNQGEYAARTLGEIRISFTYDELWEILKENSPITPLSGK